MLGNDGVIVGNDVIAVVKDKRSTAVSDPFRLSDAKAMPVKQHVTSKCILHGHKEWESKSRLRLKR